MISDSMCSLKKVKKVSSRTFHQSHDSVFTFEISPPPTSSAARMSPSHGPQPPLCAAHVKAGPGKPGGGGAKKRKKRKE